MCSKRKNLPDVAKESSANIGLLLDRFAEVDSESNQEFLKACATQRDDVYKAAYERWLNTVEADSCTVVSPQELKVQGRLISGMGIASPLETGIALHHTYGVPWLPGSGLKGLAAHYCDKVWGAEDASFKKDGPAYEIMFGSENRAGGLVFHDGWHVPSSVPFKLDVLTTHHQDYYSSKAERPTDFDTPVPVQFLSVVGSFKVAVKCLFDGHSDEEQKKAKDWAVLGLNLLQEALAYWGFGGKTNAGYGRLISDEFATAEAVEKQKNELSNSIFEKLNDVALAEVVVDGGAKVKATVRGVLRELQCKKFASAKAGNTVKIKAVEWPKKKDFPTMCEIIEVL